MYRAKRVVLKTTMYAHVFVIQIQIEIQFSLKKMTHKIKQSRTKNRKNTKKIQKN